MVTFSFEVIADQTGHPSLPSYLIDFGDGTNSTFSVNIAAVISPFTVYKYSIIHLYSNPGTYTYTWHLTVTFTEYNNTLVNGTCKNNFEAVYTYSAKDEFGHPPW